MEKRFREFTKSEWNRALHQAAKRPLSAGATFHQALRGYELWYKGEKIYPFEAWIIGFKDAIDIIVGETLIKCFKK